MWIYTELTLYYLSTHGNLFKHIQCDLRFQFFFVSCCGSRYITYLLVWLVYQLGSVKTICIMIDALGLLLYLFLNHSPAKCTILIIFLINLFFYLQTVLQNNVNASNAFYKNIIPTLKFVIKQKNRSISMATALKMQNDQHHVVYNLISNTKHKQKPLLLN